MNQQILLSSTPIIGKSYTAKGLVHGFSIHSLGLGNKWAADWASFWGSNSALSGIENKYLQCKQQAIQRMQMDAANRYRTATAIVGVQVQLSEVLMSGGNDTMLVCNAYGTAVREKLTKKNSQENSKDALPQVKQMVMTSPPSTTTAQPMGGGGGGRTRRKIFRTSTRQYAHHHHRRSLRRPASGRRRT